MGDLHRKIGLGTVQFGTNYGISNSTGQTNPEEVNRVLKTAISVDITLLDTAAAYGSAEKVIGQNDLSGFSIISKFMPPESGQNIESQIAKTLKNLNVSSIYGYLAHRPVHLARNLSIWDDLIDLKSKGYVQNIGLSLNSPDELDPFLNHDIFPDIIQLPYHYFDRRFERVMSLMKGKDCEIHARSAFFQGLFFMDPSRLDSFFDELKPALKRLQAEIKNIPGSLLHFVLQNPLIDNVIIGVENNRQLIENVKSLKQPEKLPELTETFSDHLLTPSKWPK